MLTMQMIKIMDRLWLKSGLDLKIITFACLATGPKKGMGKIEYLVNTYYTCMDWGRGGGGPDPLPGKLNFT